jgi:hypothetical protein
MWLIQQTQDTHKNYHQKQRRIWEVSNAGTISFRGCFRRMFSCFLLKTRPTIRPMFNNPPRFHMVSGSSSPLIVTRDTRAWQLQVWVSFGLAVFLCATGLAYPPGQALDRAFMVRGYVFCLSTVFVLAKTLRDRYEADLIDHHRHQAHVQEQ